MSEVTLPPRHMIETQTLEVRGRARYLSVTEAPHNTDFVRVDGEETFLLLSNHRDRETSLEL